MKSSNQNQMVHTENSQRKNMVISVYLQEIKALMFNLFPKVTTSILQK